MKLFRNLFKRSDETEEAPVETPVAPVQEAATTTTYHTEVMDTDTIIRKLGEVLVKQGEEAMSANAVEYAPQLSTHDLNYLRARLHAPPAAPKDIESGMSLGEWQAICQYVIFELVYHFEEPPLPFIRSFAFGEYDWTQATALMILTRLSVEGRMDDIVPEINKKIGEMRDETQLYYGRALLLKGREDDRYLKVIERLTSEAFQQAVAELRNNNN